jgi:hypothetical protein
MRQEFCILKEDKWITCHYEVSGCVGWDYVAGFWTRRHTRKHKAAVRRHVQNQGTVTEVRVPARTAWVPRHQFSLQTSLPTFRDVSVGPHQRCAPTVRTFPRAQLAPGLVQSRLLFLGTGLQQRTTPKGRKSLRLCEDCPVFPFPPHHSTSSRALK